MFVYIVSQHVMCWCRFVVLVGWVGCVCACVVVGPDLQLESWHPVSLVACPMVRLVCVMCMVFPLCYGSVLVWCLDLTWWWAGLRNLVCQNLQCRLVLFRRPFTSCVLGFVCGLGMCFSYGTPVIVWCRLVV